MSDEEELDSAEPESGRFNQPADEAEVKKKKLHWKIAWAVIRALAVFASFLVLARWMGGVWANGWFQLILGLLIAGGIPTGFFVLIRQQSKKSGGTARFSWLTLAAMLSAPVLLYTAIQHPTTFVDAARDEGIGAIKWVARAVGSREAGSPAVEDGGDAPDDTPAIAEDAIDEEIGATAGGAGDVRAVPVDVPPSDDRTSTPAITVVGEPIPFESHGGHMILEASINGRDPVPFILDTGATHSTLSSAALTELGLAVGPDAPRRTMQTAGGTTEGPLLLVDEVAIGDQRRVGVAFWVCEPCAIGDAVGLLGLNVWQGYLLTIDPVEQTVWLRPKESAASRTLDIEPFLGVSVESTRVEGENLHVDLRLHNRSGRDIRQAVALVTVLDGAGAEIGAFSVDSTAIAAGETKVTHASMLQAGEAKQVQVELIDARW